MPSKTKYFRYLIAFPDPQHPFLEIPSNAKGFQCFIFLQITFAPFNPETLPELRPCTPGRRSLAFASQPLVACGGLPVAGRCFPAFAFWSLITGRWSLAFVSRSLISDR
jgi:hypothetical protein